MFSLIDSTFWLLAVTSIRLQGRGLAASLPFIVSDSPVLIQPNGDSLNVNATLILNTTLPAVVG